MTTTQTINAISKVRHPDKYKCVLLCIDKENDGFECIVPIKRVSYYRKNFKHNGNYIDYASTDVYGYYEAIYHKRMNRGDPR